MPTYLSSIKTDVKVVCSVTCRFVWWSQFQSLMSKLNGIVQKAAIQNSGNSINRQHKCDTDTVCSHILAACNRKTSFNFECVALAQMSWGEHGESENGSLNNMSPWTLAFNSIRFGLMSESSNKYQNSNRNTFAEQRHSVFRSTMNRQRVCECMLCVPYLNV